MVTRMSIWRSFSVYPNVVEFARGHGLAAAGISSSKCASSMTTAPLERPMTKVADAIHTWSERQRQLSDAIEDLRATADNRTKEPPVETPLVSTPGSADVFRHEAGNGAVLLEAKHLQAVTTWIRALSRREWLLSDSIARLRMETSSGSTTEAASSSPYSATTLEPIPVNGAMAVAPFPPSVRSDVLTVDEPPQSPFVIDVPDPVGAPPSHLPDDPSIDHSDSVSASTPHSLDEFSASTPHSLDEFSASPPHPLDDFIAELSTKVPLSPFEDLIAAVAKPAITRSTGPPPPPDRFRVRVAEVGRPHRTTKRKYDYFEDLNADIAANSERS
jgi:hypothetical protein